MLKASLALLLVNAACYQTVRVRPEELPKLNDTQTRVTYEVTSRGNTVVLEDSVRHLVAEDGRVVEVRGQPAVALETRDGRRLDFRYPILASVAGEQLLEIAGGNRARTGIPLSEVRSARVTTLDREKSAAAALGITALLTIPLTVVVIAAAH